ncbi:Spo0B domain-containing protein [Desulfurispora thermophila]|uniref:Spo0B domain-containing protein n=1 Tax=Desulfurispora thermophila TaxID=265470 RepID=UPI00037588BB|nr:Spo0B domain-containing protein [Desulfurispora thermophila]
MKTEKMLELLSVLRHDFLNHLQVISGLLQLNKPERVMDYIKEVSYSIASLSKVVHLKNSEAAAAMLVGSYEAAKEQVELRFHVKTDLAQIDLPDELVGEVLLAAVGAAVSCLVLDKQVDRYLEINLLEHPRWYVCRVTIPVDETVCLNWWQERLGGLDSKLRARGGRINVVFSAGVTELVINLPRRLLHAAG